ncbi:MAG: hypothetical protein NZL95_01695 [Chitinophagales bacterium]|nr:hypothetical protein [Chitinophagales bacterium]MDW8427249.1 hypothetical protein [Chitinophagales bacterium]
MKQGFAWALALLTAMTACETPSNQVVVPNFKLQVHVVHHTWPVGGCKVYLKRNATQWPGRNPVAYDDSALTNAAGFCLFDSLFYGDYYLYAIGWDKLVQDSVTGNSWVPLTPHNVRDGRCDTVLWVSEQAPH